MSTDPGSTRHVGLLMGGYGMGSVFGGLNGDNNEKNTKETSVHRLVKPDSEHNGSIFGGLGRQHEEPVKHAVNEASTVSVNTNNDSAGVNANPFGGLGSVASTGNSTGSDGANSNATNGLNPFGGLGSSSGNTITNGNSATRETSNNSKNHSAVTGESGKVDSVSSISAGNPFSGKPFNSNPFNGVTGSNSNRSSNTVASNDSTSVNGDNGTGERVPVSDGGSSITGGDGAVKHGSVDGKHGSVGSDDSSVTGSSIKRDGYRGAGESSSLVHNHEKSVMGNTVSNKNNGDAGNGHGVSGHEHDVTGNYGVDSVSVPVDSDAGAGGFDPEWSESTGAGEDVDAFIGGSFLDLGEDDETTSDGLFGPLGSSSDSTLNGSGISDGHDDASDGGLLSGEDLVAPPTWKATSSHDPGDDGQQSIAWNKKPLPESGTVAGSGITRIERYHRASRSEMQARGEVAARVNAAGGLDGSMMDPKSGKLVDGESGKPVLAVGPSSVDAAALAMGVAVGSGKQKLAVQLRNKRTVDAAVARRVQVLEWKKGFHVPFGQREIRALDFLVRWSYATTAQIARAAGWREKKESRLVRKIEKWEEMGWVREDTVFAGPRLWYPRSDGAELSLHSWLGGVSPARVNPMSQSHSLGLSSLASWLVCPWEDKPDVLGLGDDWPVLVKEINDGEAIVCGEREYRSAWSRLRKSCKGLLPGEYRNAFIGDVVHGGTGRWQEWARDYRDGKARLEDAPDWVACDSSLMGVDMWLWTVFSNSVWNPKLVFEAAGVDAGSLGPGERGEVLADDRWRQAGYVPVEDRLDIASNRPVLRRDLGDEFVLLDHLPDIIIVRKRDAVTGGSRSIAVELELSVKSVDDYARSLAGYGSRLGRTLYSDVVWVVPSMAVATAIKRGGLLVGMLEGRDYRIVPFVTAAKRNSFWSGADIVPARFDKYHRVEPIVDLGGFLWS